MRAPIVHAVLVAALAIAVPTALFAGSAPKLVFKENVWDFGEMPQQEERTHVFQFTNTGDAPLKVHRTQTSCGCTAALATQGDIPPGGTGEIRVSYNSKSTTGHQEKTVTVYSNAPDSVTTVVVKATVKRDVNYPALLQFGQVRRGETSEQTTEVTAEAGVDFQISKVESDAAYIKPSFVPLAAKAGMGPAYKINVALSPDAPVGPISNRLRIFCNLPKRPVLEVSLLGQVMGDLKVSSNVVNFGNVTAGAAQPVVVKVEAPATHPIHVTKVRTSTPDVSASFTTLKEGQSYEVHCTLAPTKVGGMISGKLIIETSDPAEAKRELQLLGFVKG
jgi:hypothetical protein